MALEKSRATLLLLLTEQGDVRTPEDDLEFTEAEKEELRAFAIEYAIGDKYAETRAMIRIIRERCDPNYPSSPLKPKRRKRNAWGVVDEDGENADTREFKRVT